MTAPRIVHWLARAAGHAPAAAVPPADAVPPFDPADFAPRLRTRLLVLQPTPFCNIDCDYCYLPQRTATHRMSMQTVRLAAERLRDDGLVGAALSVVWHGGEPMTLPAAYLEEAIGTLDAVLAPHCRVDHALQTNAILVDDAWCALIRRRGIRVGVSVDGPAAVHDAHRRARTGRGTHAAVLRGMARLRAAGIPFHAIAVVGAATLADPDGFADFFEAQGITELGCNFDEQEGAHARSSLTGHEARHHAFLERLLARMDCAPGRLRVRELAWARERVARPLPPVRWRGHAWPDNAQVIPFALVNVAHDGGFGTFSPELLGQPAPAHDDFVFGHVAQGGVLAAAARPAFQAAWQAVVRGVLACERGCAYFAHCGGGAPANKFYELGDLGGTQTLYCRTTLQRPFDVALAAAERELAGRAEAPVHAPLAPL